MNCIMYNCHYYARFLMRIITFSSICLCTIECAKDRSWLGPIQFLEGNPPSRRQGAALTSAQENLYLFGGNDLHGNTLNDLYMFDTITREWTDLSAVDSSPPSPRTGHAFATLGNGTMIVFAGADQDGMLRRLKSCQFSHLMLTTENSLNDFYYFDHANFGWWNATETMLGEAPSPRSNFGFTMSNSEFVVFGGFNDYGECFDDLYSLDLSNNIWTNLTAKINGFRPDARWAAGLTSLGSKIYLFGGQDCSLFYGYNNGSYFGNLYMIDLSKPLEWLAVMNISGTPPSPRSGHGFASINGLLYVYGGQTENGEDNSQLFVFDPATSVWKDLAETVQGISPSPRFNFGLCTLRDTMYIFGGVNVDNTAIRINLNDMYVLSLSSVAATWMDLSGQTNGEASVPRYRPYAVTAHQRLYLYGGLAADGVNAGSMVANVSEFDITSLSWRNLSNDCVNGDQLAFKSISALAAVNDSLYLFQGNQNEDTKELFEFDFALGAWINLTQDVQGTPPSQRSFFYIASANGKLYVFGGFQNGIVFSDLYYLEVKTRTWTNLTGRIAAGASPKPRVGFGFTSAGQDLYVFGGGNDGLYFNDLHKFDSLSITWIDLTEDVHGSVPSPREFHGFVSDGSFFYCFGGYSAGYLSDLYMFDISILKWTDLTGMAQNPPSARYGHGFASLLGNLCVFGGMGVTDYLGDLRLIVSPKSVQWPLKETGYSGFVSIYDWDTIQLQAGGGILFFPLKLCTGIFPCALSVRGPGTIVREGDGSIACFASVGCTVVILESISISCDENRSSQATLKFQGSGLSIFNSTFLSCLSESDGGFIQSYDSASVQIDSCKFQDLHTSGFGGALGAVGSEIILSKTSFLNCSSDRGGGAIWISSYTCFGQDRDTLSQQALVRISQSQFRGCSTLGRGGAILSSSQFENVEVTDCFLGHNSAKLSGGAISIESSASMVIRNSDFFENLAFGIGGGAFYVDDSFMVFDNVSCKGNIAWGGGGVLFWVGSWEPLISKTLAQYIKQVTGDSNSSGNATTFEEQLCTADNRAMYGPCVATAYRSLFISGIPQQDPASPGQPLSVVVSKTDAYNQTISSDSASIILVRSALNGDINTVDRFVTLTGDTVIPFKGGQAIFSVSVQPSFRQVAWQGEIATMLTQPYMFFYGTDLQTFLPMLSDSKKVYLSEGNRVCPSGYILNLGASLLNSESARPGSCKQCQGGTYSVSPLFGTESMEPSCLQCPVGGVCFGGNNVSFAVGQWKLDGGLYRLTSCPTGHQLVDSAQGTFRQDLQECIACLPNEYILNSNSSNFSCQACPSFAICNGSVLSARIQGSAWKVDELTGRYVLISCPAGYELDLISQQCSICLAEHYCIGGSRPATACPDEYFSVAGANSSQLCLPAVFVIFSVSLPISASEFESKQQLFLDAAAATVQILPSRVVLLSVGRRSQSDVVLVDTKIAADDATQAKEVAGLMNQDTLNVQLTARAFPPATLQSVTVNLQANEFTDQSTMSRNITIAGTLAAFGAMMSFTAAGYYLLREVKRSAANKAFLVAFSNSTAGSPGTLHHLPLKLRQGFMAEMILGKGEFGIIIQVQTKKGNKKAAIKLILPSRNYFDDNETRQLKREAHVLELFTTQKCEYAVNLVGIDSINIDKDVCWFVMELLVGDNMEDVMSKHGPISDLECIKVARHVLAALKLMHAEGLLHRDIKPANIVRISSGENQSLDSKTDNDSAKHSYKLVDFGTALGVDETIAKEYMMTLSSNRKLGAGTPPYMSPEMFNSPETATYSTDLWSLGVSIFELATGFLPFVKKENESDLIWSSIIAGHMDQAAPDILDRLDETKRSKFDHNLTKVIAKALEKHTSNRYKSVDEMHHELYQCLIVKGEASYSVFISYRVASDEPIARILFDELNHSVTPGGHRVTVYWDAHRLIKGENWEEGFANGLLNSLCLFPILTYGATAPLASLPVGKFAELCSKFWEERPIGRQRLQGLEHDWEDNVLKEFLIAGALLDRTQVDVERDAKEQGMLQSIFPILMGRPHPLGTPSYPHFGDFFHVQGGAGDYPKRPSPPTSRSVADFLRKRACLPPDVVHTVEVRSVQEAVQCLTKLQGCQLWKHNPGIAEVELTKEQASLVGKGCVGPAVDLKMGGCAVQLTEEQRAACDRGYDIRQLKMLKALVREKLLDFHEVIDRSIAAAAARSAVSSVQRDNSIVANLQEESVSSGHEIVNMSSSFSFILPGQPIEVISPTHRP